MKLDPRRAQRRGHGGNAILPERVQPRLLPAVEESLVVLDASGFVVFGVVSVDEDDRSAVGGAGLAGLTAPVTALAAHPQRHVDAQQEAQAQRRESDGQVDGRLVPVGVDDGHRRVAQADEARERLVEPVGVGAEKVGAVHVGRVTAAQDVGVETRLDLFFFVFFLIVFGWFLYWYVFIFIIIFSI